MRHLHASGQRSGRFGRAALSALLASVLVGSYTGAASGSGQAGGPGTGGHNGGGGAADDETVGTLPSTDAGSWFDLYRNGLLQRPRLYVEGQLGDIETSIIALRGSNDVLVQDLGSGVSRLIFLGDSQVVFDRAMFNLYAFTTGVLVPREAAGSSSLTQWGGSRPSYQTLASGSLNLPIAAFEASGLLDSSPLRFTTSIAGWRTVLGAHADSTQVVLTQIH